MNMNNYQSSERTALLNKIKTEDFALYETVLYLNGNPTCKEALAYYCKRRDTVMELRRKYEEKYGPLTIYGNNDLNCWHWIDSPWPWEKEAN